MEDTNVAGVGNLWRRKRMNKTEGIYVGNLPIGKINKLYSLFKDYGCWLNVKTGKLVWMEVYDELHERGRTD